MLFSRRTREEWHQRLRVMLWPRRSFGRSLKYFSKRVLRLRASPHAIAGGVAIGVFVAFLPIPVFHMGIAALGAWLIGVNAVAGAIGTIFGNPLTYPVIWGATYEVGQLILEGRGAGMDHPPNIFQLFRHLEFRQLWKPIVEPMVVGALPLGLAFGALAYVLTRWAVGVFHAQRRAAQAERAQARTASPPAAAS